MDGKRGNECNTFAVAPGEKVDILELEELGSRYSITIYLYFEEELARKRTLAEDLVTYAAVPEYERPFILLEKFITFASAQDPEFRDKLKELPLILEVIACGEMMIAGAEHRYITTLMPFLDDMEALAIE